MPLAGILIASGTLSILSSKKQISFVFQLCVRLPNTIMAGSITYLAPVDNASGKIFGKKEKFTAVTRTWGKRKRGCTATGQRDLKNHPYTEKETTQKAKFITVGQAVRARMKDPTKINEDLAAFKAQTEYKTLYRFLWNLEWKKA